jgi:hypothetical protein
MEELAERRLRDAKKCRELAETVITPEARDVLIDLAKQYEHEAVLRNNRARRPAFAWELA